MSNSGGEIPGQAGSSNPPASPSPAVAAAAAAAAAAAQGAAEVAAAAEAAAAAANRQPGQLQQQGQLQQPPHLAQGNAGQLEQAAIQAQLAALSVQGDAGFPPGGAAGAAAGMAAAGEPGAAGGAGIGAGAAGDAAGVAAEQPVGAPAAASAAELTRLQQNQDNIILKLAALTDTLRAMHGNPGGAGPVVAPAAMPSSGLANFGAGSGLGSFGAAGMGGSAGSSDLDKRAMKADFDGAAASWRSNRRVWALRGKRGIEIPNKEAIQTMLKELLTGTDRVLQQLKTCSSFDILAFYPLTAGGLVGQFPVTDAFDLACTSIMSMLKFGLDPALAEDYACSTRLAPIEHAMLKARADFRLHMHRNGLTDPGMREAMADVVNDDFRAWDAALMTWMFPMVHLSSPPSSFARFHPPPVPKFDSVANFCKSGGHLIRILAAAGQGQQGSARKGGTGASGGVGGKRKADNQGAGSGKSNKICHSFRDTGSCRWGDSCKFKHVRRTANSGAGGGAGGGGVDGGANGGGSAGAGNQDADGTSSALVVRGRGSN